MLCYLFCCRVDVLFLRFVISGYLDLVLYCVVIVYGLFALVDCIDLLRVRCSLGF